MRQMQRRFIHEHADLVLGIGYDTVEVEYEAWAGERPILHIDREAADIDASVRLEHAVVGDLDASLAALSALDPLENGWTQERGGGHVRIRELEAHRADFQRALRPPVEGFTPHEAIDVVRRSLPREGVLAFDVGAHTHQIASQWIAYTPRTFLITNGWSSMGFGLPAAIAAKLARPDLPVVCIVGDGCFQMTCGEVAVARRLGLSLPIVVLDDGWLSLIQVKQARRGFALHGTDLGEHPHVEPPAHYFGVPAVAAGSADALARALRAALTADHPTVIEARVDPAHYLQTVYD
jgi:acetolactate synthase-1/2/3 large subunit